MHRYVSLDWVFIQDSFAQSIPRVTEEEVVTSSNSLKQSCNRSSREARNPATLNHSMAHLAGHLSAWKVLERNPARTEAQMGCRWMRKKSPDIPQPGTTTDNLHWPHLVSHAWLSHPLILGLYIPLFLCSYLVFSIVRTTLANQELHHFQLPILCSQVKRCLVHLWKETERNAFQASLRKHKITSCAASNTIMPLAITLLLSTVRVHRGEKCYTSKSVNFYSAVNFHSELL